MIGVLSLIVVVAAVVAADPTASCSLSPTASPFMLTFTNKISWTNFAAAQGYSAVVTETFNSYNEGLLNNGLTSNAGGIQWTASAPGGLYAGFGFMTTFNEKSLLTLTFTLLPSVQGLAGNFFATDVYFNILPAIIGVQLADGSAYVCNTSSLADFIGFYSTGASISSISISVEGNDLGRDLRLLSNGTKTYLLVNWNYELIIYSKMNIKARVCQRARVYWIV
jgi:hypothetical protein